MKTNQVMIRKMGEFNVTQRTKDGFFDANELLTQWNSTPGNPKKRLAFFKENQNTKEFIEALKEELSLCSLSDNGDFQVLTEYKGRMTRHGRTKDSIWMHPYLFVKFAMWINPRFEVKVIKFVYDEMIKYRNEAGDGYVKLAASIAKILGEVPMQVAMSKVSEGINYIVFGKHESNIRNQYGDESSQRELATLETKLAELIDDGFIESYDELLKYMRKLWQRKNNVPKCFEN